MASEVIYLCVVCFPLFLTCSGGARKTDRMPCVSTHTRMVELALDAKFDYTLDNVEVSEFLVFIITSTKDFQKIMMEKGGD